MKNFPILNNKSVHVKRSPDVLQPIVIDIEDGAGTQSAGYGLPRFAMRSAVGEYLERKHFRNLSAISPLDSGYVPTFDLIKKQRCELQVAKLALSLEPVDSETPKDSSGCSSHSSAEEALEAAFVEFVERQDLLFWWRTGRFKSIAAITNEETLDVLKKQTLRCGASFSWLEDTVFRKQACIMMIDISMASKAHKTFAALYLSTDPGAIVQFAMAAASSPKTSKALHKVLQELHHAFLGMKANVEFLNAGKELALDPILANYVMANSPKTFCFFSNEMQSVQKKPIDWAIFDSPSYTFKESILTQDLTGALPWATEILLYLQPKRFSGNWTWYSRVLSKDGYLAIHSNIEDRPRIEAAFKTIERSRNPIPFP